MRAHRRSERDLLSHNRYRVTPSVLRWCKDRVTAKRDRRLQAFTVAAARRRAPCTHVLDAGRRIAPHLSFPSCQLLFSALRWASGFPRGPAAAGGPSVGTGSGATDRTPECPRSPLETSASLQRKLRPSNTSGTGLVHEAGNHAGQAVVSSLEGGCSPSLSPQATLLPHEEDWRLSPRLAPSPPEHHLGGPLWDPNFCDRTCSARGGPPPHHLETTPCLRA